MINVILFGEKTEVKEGTRVIELLDPAEARKYCLCKVGTQIKELKYRLAEVHDGMQIEFLGLGDMEAGRAYEATLRFIVAMAFKNIYPDVRISFSYDVSRAVFCRSLTPGFSMNRSYESICAEVRRIIEADMEIDRLSIPKEQAPDIYRENGLEDKLELLRYRPENFIHMYRCGGYMNYMHAYMLPSTGYIRDYAIAPYSPGLLIQYPRIELSGETSEAADNTTYDKTLQKAYVWSSRTRLQTVADVNRMIGEGHMLELVHMCEARHAGMFAEIGDAVEKDRESIRLICIAGPSSSGKTTFCNRLRIELMSRGINPVMISMDDYYRDREDICREQNLPPDKVDLEHVNCLNISRFNRDMSDLINGEEVTLPHYDFMTKKSVPGKTITVSEDYPIMIEGIHALNESLTSSIPKHLKYKIYIAPQAQFNLDDVSPLNITDLRLIRRIVRDMSFRNSPAAKTIDMWKSVRKGEYRWIYPNQSGANYIFNSVLMYELCVLRKRAIPALKEIGPEDPQYLVANRLLKYLKYFTDLDDESVIPCNSLIREFIGGSCFKV